MGHLSETKLAIMNFLLSEGELWQSEIARRLELSQVTIREHLLELEKAGLVSSRKIGNTIMYRVNEELVLNYFKSFPALYNLIITDFINNVTKLKEKQANSTQYIRNK